MKLLIFMVASICIVGAPSASTASNTPGLNYSYYKGTWNSLPNFNSLTPAKKGITQNFDLGVRDTTASYGIVWQGFISVPTAGTYTFQTYSDDGSQLFINNSATPLVNNDGVHADSLVSGNIYLDAGSYPIKVCYFQKTGNQTMEVYWQSNTGLARQRIPDAALTIDGASSDGMTGSRNFYFSSVTGDDSRSELQAQNPASPWKSLSKLNSYFSSLQPGDAVLFKRGETFDGSISIGKSGSASAPIIFSAYGTGNKPVINGLTTLGPWTSVGTNLYEASVAANGRVNMLTVNGVVKALGRYPDSSYLTIDSRTDLVSGPANTYTGTITDAESPASTVNWKGAEVVIRKNEYILDRCLITDHSGTTISYNSPSSTAPTPGYGYFIQNSPLTLDHQNEWYYNPSTRKLRIYSTVNPSTLVIKASIVETLVSIDNKTDLTFDNISFEGADTSAFDIKNKSANINIQNCNFNYSGIEVLRGTSVNHITFANNTTNNTNSYGIIMYGCSDITVKNNIIKNTGMLAGMGLSNQQGYGAIFVQGGNTLIEGNYVDSVGQSAVAFNGGNNLMCRNNYINYFCRVVGDGGGIYTNGNDGFTGKRIVGNIVSNGYGNNEGTLSPVPRAANGIYIDEGGSNVEVLNNTVFNCISNGIYVHQSHELVIKGNILYNNDCSQLSIVDDQPPADRIRNVRVAYNILFAKKSSQMVVYNASTSNDLAQFGSYDSNYYARPFDLGGIIATQYKIPEGEVSSYFDLPAWSNKNAGWDANTYSGSPIKQYLVTKAGSNILTDGAFNTSTNLITPDQGTIITLDTKLDGKAAKFTAKSPSIPDIGGLISLGSTTAGKIYRIKFSLIGSTNTQNLISYVRRFDDPDYSIVSETKHFPLRTVRTECEYIYIASKNEKDVRLTIIASGLLMPFWIDNVDVSPVEVTFTNIEDFVRFEYNNTNTVKSVVLDGDYSDNQNVRYSSRVDLKPFTSIVLIKVQSETGSQSSQMKTAEINISELTSKPGVPELSVYPNPVVHALKTKILSDNTGKIAMTIYNENGMAVQSAVYEKTDRLFDESVNVSALPRGGYFVRYKFDDQRSVTKKFVKQ